MCTLIQYITEYSATHDVLKMCIYNYMHTCALPFPARCIYRIAGNIGKNYIWRFGKKTRDGRYLTVAISVI